MTPPLIPPLRLGVLGSGQLARMIALAAAPLGARTHVFAPEDGPAFDVAAVAVRAAYDDLDALRRFAADVDAVTLEFENVPVETVRHLETLVPVRPGARALERTQDRLVEKRFLQSIGLATAPFAPVDGPANLAAALAAVGLPAILKTRRLGYDGRGQARVASPAEAEAALAAIGGGPAILEGVVPFAFEVSQVLARGVNGATAAFDPAFNVHEGGILRRSTNRPPPEAQGFDPASARNAAVKVAEALGYVGVLAVEFFVVRQGEGFRLVANEVAPRVHNSGHWTIEGAQTSQFAQAARAALGLPLGSPASRGEFEMVNLIGNDADAAGVALADANAQLHLYGKVEPRPGRKMGHVTRRLDHDPDARPGPRDDFFTRVTFIVFALILFLYLIFFVFRFFAGRTMHVYDELILFAIVMAITGLQIGAMSAWRLVFHAKVRSIKSLLGSRS